MPFARLFCLILTLAALLAAPAVRAGSITVFAAASLKTALDEIAAGFEAESGHSVILSYAGSSALARQIQLGAPADVFISANPGWMNYLQQQDLIAPSSRFDLLGNQLVLIAHGSGAAPVEISSDLDLAAMLEGRPLAMALADAVPAGIYAKAALSALGLWDQTAPLAAQASNARAALALVASGEAPLGIVYATDAAASSHVSVIGTFPAHSHPPIIYPAAATAAGAAETAAFLAYLRGDTARDAFTRQGFTVLAE